MKNPAVSFIILLLITVSCSTGENRKNDLPIKYVQPESGLVLREGAGKSFNKITIIPFNSKVSVLERSDKTEIISGRRGTWVKIVWLDKNTNQKNVGWCFDAYLGNKPVIRDSDLVFDGDPVKNIILNRSFSKYDAGDIVKFDIDYIPGSSESYWEEIIFLPDNKFEYSMNSSHSFDRGESFRDRFIFTGTYQISDRVVHLTYLLCRRTNDCSSCDKHEGTPVKLVTVNCPNMLRSAETDEKCYLKSLKGRIYIHEKKYKF